MSEGPHDVTITILSTSGGAPTFVTRRAVPLASGDVVLMSGLAAPVAFMGYPPKGVDAFAYGLTRGEEIAVITDAGWALLSVMDLGVKPRKEIA